MDGTITKPKFSPFVKNYAQNSDFYVQLQKLFTL